MKFRIFPDDHKLAAEKYPGRESATDRAIRKAAKPAKSAAEAARLCQEWEDSGGLVR